MFTGEGSRREVLVTSLGRRKTVYGTNQISVDFTIKDKKRTHFRRLGGNCPVTFVSKLNGVSSDSKPDVLLRSRVYL